MSMSISQQEIDSLLNLYENQKFEDAKKLAISLIKKSPKHPYPWKILGVLLKQLGDIDQALAVMKKSIQISPKDPENYNNLAFTFLNLNRLNEAEQIYNQAIKLNPNYTLAYYNLGNTYRRNRKFKNAEYVYRQLIKLKPDYIEAYNNLGLTLLELERFEEAEKVFLKILRLKPDYIIAHFNLGTTLLELGRLDEAEKKLKQTIELKPDYAEAYNRLSYVKNLKGDLKSGFKLYEWRLLLNTYSAQPPRKDFGWSLDKPLKGKKIIVYEEQGLGDIIQFFRFLPLLEKKGAKVIFKVKKKLHQILTSTNNNISLTDDLPNDSDVDFETPLMSIPYLLETEVKTIPANTPYLEANSNRVVMWGKKLISDKFKIGICWQSGKSKFYKGRSFSLSNFREISNIPGVELISLYKDSDENEILNLDFNITTLGKEFDNQGDAFIDTAAVMKNCNLIITCDTSIAHLAGALGCNVWVVLKKIPEWRWMLNRSDSPWYPTMRLYRQKDFGQWEPVFNLIKSDLEEIIKKSQFNKK